VLAKRCCDLQSVSKNSENQAITSTKNAEVEVFCAPVSSEELAIRNVNRL